MIKIGKNIILNEDDIIFIDHYNKTTYVHTNSVTYSTYISIKHLMETLPNNFIVINKGVVVNKNHIKEISNGRYMMSNGEWVWGSIRRAGFHRRLEKELKGIKIIKK